MTLIASYHPPAASRWRAPFPSNDKNRVEPPAADYAVHSTEVRGKSSVPATVLNNALKSGCRISAPKGKPGPTTDKLHFAGNKDNPFTYLANTPVMIASGYEDQFIKAATSPHAMAAVIEDVDGHTTILDLDTKFFNQGIVMVEGPVTDQMAARIRRQLQYLASKRKEEGKDAPIVLMIDSPGGSMIAMLAIADEIKMTRNTKVKGKHIPVIALINGMAASAGSVIASSVTDCYMTPNSFFMLHSPISGSRNEWAGLNDDLRFTQRLLDRALDIYSEKTGYSKKELADWTYRGARWLDAEQSQKMGLSQGIIHSFDEFTTLEVPSRQKHKGGKPDLWSIEPAPVEPGTARKAPSRRRTPKAKTPTALPDPPQTESKKESKK
jgi:ATP-dependent Clp endopeptidase proteolytic subunit ClpP